MPPQLEIVPALEFILDDIRSGAVSEEFFRRTPSQKTYAPTRTRWPEGGLLFSKMGISEQPEPSQSIGYKISFGPRAPYSFVLYVDDPSDDPAVNRRAVLAGYEVLRTTPNAGVSMHTVSALTYVQA